MPRLIYTPEGSDTPKTWDFSFGRLLSPERIAIEKMTGIGWQNVQRGFFENRGDVIHALLYVLLKREIPALRPDEVVFCDDEIGLDVTDEEAAETLKVLRAKANLTEDEANALAELEGRDSGDEGAEDDGPKED